MRRRVLGFVTALRDAGVGCSVSESLDAAEAVATLGVAHGALREGLAATLVKDQDDRPTFDTVFDRYFGVPPRAAKRPRRAAEGGSGTGGQGEGGGRARAAEEARAATHTRQREDAQGPDSRASQRLAERRALLVKPFEAMDAREVEELRELVDDLGRHFRARWSRRSRRANLGRVDVRRTIRRATSRGGVPVELLYRKPRPGKTDLIALVDLSYSAATAASFLLALLAPARRFFRRVRFLAYVDAIAEISYERGHVVPHQHLDLNARSDFGRVLTQLTEREGTRLGRNTVLLILGDARNNRRPPRADLLAALGRTLRAVVWLNPEQRARWDTGDSVMSSYARHCDMVVNAWNMKTLLAALRQVSRLAG